MYALFLLFCELFIIVSNHKAMHNIFDRITNGLDNDYNRISSLNKRICDSYFSAKNAISLNELGKELDGILKEKYLGAFKEKKAVKKVQGDKIIKENIYLNFISGYLVNGDSILNKVKNIQCLYKLEEKIKILKRNKEKGGDIYKDNKIKLNNNILKKYKVKEKKIIFKNIKKEDKILKKVHNFN